jgi:phosphatidylglycerol:prolipoprotein diacylglycerol transferase
VTGYGAAVLLGFLAGLLVRSRLRDAPVLPAEQRWPLLAAVVLGGAVGAYLGELPADVLGWAWRPAGTEPFGGRTVLGGILGGWLAVELEKRRLGIRIPTGDGVAAPLAAALAIGRLGCVAAGCCAGAVCDPAAWYGVDGRFPAVAVEAGFHAIALVLLLVADRRGWARGRRLYAYLIAYGAARFLLETGRANPQIMAGITWYQLLALAVLGLGWWRWRAAGRSMPG